jgi:hypothetical protein
LIVLLCFGLWLSCEGAGTTVLPGPETPQNLIVSGPARTGYFTGNSFSTAGLSVRAAYADGSSVTIDSGYTLSWDGQTISHGDTAITAETGTKTVTVNWHESAANFTISVNEQGEPITVSDPAGWANALSTITSAGGGTSSEWEDYTIELSGDFKVPGSDPYGSSTFGSLQYVIVNLTGSGTISLDSQGNMFKLGQDQTLVIEGPTLKGLKYGENGATQDNNTSVVYLDHTDSTLELRSGEISGNSYNGVEVYNGSFTMSGGEISGNGYIGVNVGSGSLTLSGGDISGNGSGVYIDSNGFFTMSDGEISDNSGYGGNGGVVVMGSFTMSGGKISDNTGNYSYGLNNGGVFVYNGSFTMTSGEISGNSVGPGVSVSGGSFTLSDGKISDNTAGGVYVSNNGSFTMSGGEISGNTAGPISGNSGGGVYVYSTGSFNKSEGGVIYGYDSADAENPLWNKAHNGDPAYGHAVYFYKDSGNQYYRDTTLAAGDDISTETLPTSAGDGNTVGNWIKK